ncbi:glutathione-dependent formaldehyde dehydrogenase [bacterium]|nr:MAG: glutathione-dependent formaldehyde dehydrogenase [bacterium]
MKAAVWMGKHDVRVEEMPDPQILSPKDIIVRITSTAICGSDLHLYNGHVPTMKEYDIPGHEFMGEIVEIGKDVKQFRIGDRVIIPFPIACGCCFFCSFGMTSACDNTNPNAGQQEEGYSQPGAAIYGYSHMFGGYDGGQAEYARVPFADANAFRVPEGIPDEKLLMLTDAYPTGFQAVDQAGVAREFTVAIWGGGPVGQFAAMSARLLGAKQIIMIDHVTARLDLAERLSGAERLDFEKDTEDSDVVEQIKMRTGGRGADVCIDAVGMEGLGHGAGAILDHAKTILRTQADRPVAFRQAIMACRKLGVVSFPGVYAGLADKIPLGQAMNKGLRFATGQTAVHRYLPKLLDYIVRGDIDPSAIISHVVPLDRAGEMYDLFNRRDEGCTKVVMKPGLTAADIDQTGGTNAAHVL